MRGHMGNERYCGNYITKTVHDVTSEQSECLLEECFEKGIDIPFDSLEVAQKAGYKNCQFCLSS